MITLKKRNKAMKSILDAYNIVKKDTEKIDLKFILKYNNIKNEKDFMDTVLILESMNYLEYIKPLELKSGDGSTTLSSDFVVLSKPGKCYFETNSDNRKAFWRKSILTPIIVAFITSILAELLKCIL